jgi:paraquat-inducible protein B
MAMVRNVLMSLILGLVFLGCKEDALHIKARYDQIQGLEEADRVIFEDNRIGQVTGVFYSEHGYYLVDLAIERHFANAVTEHAAFFIIADPQNEGQKAIEMIQTRRGGSPLQDGATVQGSIRSSAVFSQMRGDFEKGLDHFKEQFEQFFEDLKSLPEHEEVKKLEKELERLAETMMKSSKSVQKEIQKEWLPWLKEEISKLRERLRKFGREEELEPLDTQMEKIMEI